MSEQTPHKFGRTPWDLLLTLTRNRSVLLWTWALAWGLLVLFALAWYHDVLPKRSTATTGSPQDGSHYAHWWLDPSPATLDQCTNASLKIHTNAGANPVESTDRDQQTTGTTGVYGSIVAVIGCVRMNTKAASFVFVAGPEQSAAKNKAALLRTMLTSELRAGK